jgi:hypothetical protein
MENELDGFEWSHIVDHLEDESEKLTTEVKRLKAKSVKIDKHHEQEIKGLRDEIELLTMQVKALHQRYE